MKLDEAKVWRGTYRGIRFKIENFSGMGFMDSWTYYIYIHIDRMSDASLWLKGKKEGRGRHVIYDYSSTPLADLDWHCGITWYAKLGGHDGSGKIVEAGCDYQHWYDEGRTYSETGIANEVKDTIDSFYRKYPDYKQWCRGNGKLYSINEGKVLNGEFYSEEYYGDKEFYKKEQVNEQK